MAYYFLCRQNLVPNRGTAPRTRGACHLCPELIYPKVLIKYYLNNNKILL